MGLLAQRYHCVASFKSARLSVFKIHTQRYSLLLPGTEYYGLRVHCVKAGAVARSEVLFCKTWLQPEEDEIN